MTPHALAITALVFSIALGSAPLRAAPATSEELADSIPRSTSGQAPATGMALPATTGVEQSRTVELLLQLQDQPAARRGAGGEASRTDAARHGSTVSPVRAADVAAPAAAPPLKELKESLLGIGSDGGSALADRRAAEDSVADRVPSSSVGSPAWSGVRTGSSESRSTLLSHPVIRFIRENRGLTVAVSLGVLVAVWLATSYRGRARRR